MTPNDYHLASDIIHSFFCFLAEVLSNFNFSRICNISSEKKVKNYNSNTEGQCNSSNSDLFFIIYGT